MFPDVEGEDGAEAGGRPFGKLRDRPTDGVAGAGFLGDDEGTVGGGGEPDPAGAEEADALGDELFLEGIDGAPLLDHLLAEGRILGKITRLGQARQDDRSPLPLRHRRHNKSFGSRELGEVQVVVQDLAGVVEDGLARRPFDRLRDRLR